MRFRSDADSVPSVGLESCLPACALMVAYVTYFRVCDRPQNNRKRGPTVVAKDIWDVEEVPMQEAEREAERESRQGSTATGGSAPDLQAPSLPTLLTTATPAPVVDPHTPTAVCSKSIR